MKKYFSLFLFVVLFSFVVFSAYAQDTGVDFTPNIRPAEFSIETAGDAFDWGTDYQTVHDFISQIPSFEITNELEGMLEIMRRNPSPETYTFSFKSNKLYKITAKIYSMWMGGGDLPTIVGKLKKAYGLNDTSVYTESNKLNKSAENANASFIAADDYTVYAFLSIVESGNRLSHVDAEFYDRNMLENNIISADAGIVRPGKDQNQDQSSDTGAVESTEGDKPAAFDFSDSQQVGNCRYGTHFSLGEKGEIVNTTALRMYNKANGMTKEGIQAFPGKEFTTTDGPVCVDGAIWWEINFLGYLGWVTEVNGQGTYYMEKK